MQPPPDGEAIVARQAEMFANRLVKTRRKLAAAFERQGVGAYRLYDRDIPEIRAVCDWYEGHLVVGEYARTQTDLLPDWLGGIARAGAAALGVPEDKVHLRSRRTRPKEGERYGPLGDEGGRLAVREGGLSFLVNLDDYLDTGLFLDHRLTRARVRDESKGKHVLNLYGYTGAFSVYAADGGAASTTTVDASRRYVAWAKDNLAENRYDDRAHEVVSAEVRRFVGDARRGRTRWDLIVLDPPSFSDREGGLDVERDHPTLLREVLELLSPGGVLYFSTNHQAFTPRMEGVGREAEEITAQTVPHDFRNRHVHRAWRIVR